MKYLMLLVFGLLAWMLIDEFVFQDRGAEGLDTFGDKLKDLGKRFHIVFGILAVLILLSLAVQAILYSVNLP
jgi:DMSO/TMAO reductase YedYZ heme-binding membrane subunit